MATSSNRTAVPIAASTVLAMPSSYYLTALFLLYILLCSLVRFRRRDAMHKKYNYRDKASLSKMTNDDAQAIMKYLVELEFPRVYELSLQFALFKVGGSSYVYHVFHSNI